MFIVKNERNAKNTHLGWGQNTGYLLPAGSHPQLKQKQNTDIKHIEARKEEKWKI